jgi:single-strand DNA-binding protein
MRGFSKAIIAGNLTRDPELRSTPNGASVCSFSVAVNRTFRDSNGEQKEDVSFIDCSAWGKLGEMINQYAKKGTGVLISGRLSQHSWEDKDGKKRSRTEIVVEDFNFTGARSDNSSSYSSADSQVEEPVDIPSDIPEEEIDLSEVPF